MTTASDYPRRGPVTDPRAGALLRRYLDRFGGPVIPVPVERRIRVNAVEARQTPGRRERLPAAEEVNVFAAERLMPMEAVRDVFRENDSIDMTATRFGISALAMHRRLCSAELVSLHPSDRVA